MNDSKSESKKNKAPKLERFFNPLTGQSVFAENREDSISLMNKKSKNGV